MAKKKRIPHKFLPWIDVRKKFKLSDAHVQMARELGLSPKRFPNYANTKDQPWKLPLAQFIEQLYEKQFGKTRPDEVMSIEAMAEAHLAKRAARKLQKQQAEQAGDADSEQAPQPLQDTEPSQEVDQQDPQPQDVEGSA